MAAHSNKEKGQAVYSTLSVFGLPANLHSCGICYEPFITNAATTSASTAPNHGQYLACLHSYCDPCLSTYVSTKLQGNVNPFPLHCPEPECLFEVADKHIKSILSNKDYDLWIRKKAESDMCGKMYCPNKRCSELLTVANLSKADNCLAACTSCYHAICVRCKRLWHNGYSCKEYSQLSTKERLADDYDVLVMAQSNKWRRCTKCKTLVELKYGCNHITCHCGHQFCYKCGEDWDLMKKLCSSGGCELWDEDMLVRARGEQVPDPQPQIQQQIQQNIQRIHQMHQIQQEVRQRIQQQQPQPQRQQPQPQRQQPQPQMQRQQPQQILFLPTLMLDEPVKRDLGVDLRYIEALPRTMISKWLYSSVHGCYCGYCDKDFINLHALQQHLETVRSHDVYYCCGKLFPNEHSFQMHQDSSGCQNNSDAGDELVKRDLGVHLSYIEALPRTMISKWLYSSVHGCYCGYCDKDFINLHALQQHLETVRSHDVYYCCGKLFPNEHSLQMHQDSSGCLMI